MSFAITFFSTSNSNRLMNMKLALREGIPKILVNATFVCAFFLLFYFSGGIDNSIGGIIIISLFVLLITQLNHTLYNITHPAIRKLFFPDGYDHKKIKNQLKSKLEDCTEAPQLATLLNDTLHQIIEASNFHIIVTPDDNVTDDSGYNRIVNIGFSLTETTNSSIISYLENHTSLLLIDEVPFAIKQEMTKLDIEAIAPIRYKGIVIGAVACNTPRSLKNFRNEDLFLIQWLGDSLGRVLERISRFKNIHDELTEARKTISLIGVMNQYHHDIKTPLAIIDGVVSADIYDQEKQREIVLEQVERGTRLIATMASILRGKRNRKISPLSIEDIIRDCLFVFEKRFHSVSLEFSEVPLFEGDAVDLKIMFVNIIKNASEAARNGADLNLSIKIGLKNKHTYVSIKDSGTGINDEHLASLWESSRSDKKSGSGVGLQAIKRIADEHRISISVNSAIGKGTEFIFDFPR